MSKVLVDPAALEEAAKWLEVHSSSSGSAEAFAAEALREAIARPAEAEGVELWAVHAQGPDELYAAFSREDAEQHAEELNGLSMPAGIQVLAVVIPSPWPAAEHWKYAAELEREHTLELKSISSRFEKARPTEAEHHVKLLGQALGECISASGIIRADASLCGPELLMFAEDLKCHITEQAAALSAVTAERDRVLAEREGKVLVPTEPTEAMLTAYSTNPNHVASAGAIYRAMLSAAMAAKEAEPEHVCSGCGAKGWTGNCLECIPY
jgi:hypothetical protein